MQTYPNQIDLLSMWFRFRGCAPAEHQGHHSNQLLDASPRVSRNLYEKISCGAAHSLVRLSPAWEAHWENADSAEQKAVATSIAIGGADVWIYVNISSFTRGAKNRMARVKGVRPK
jgi:hypothetical protein